MTPEELTSVEAKKAVLRDRIGVCVERLRAACADLETTIATYPNDAKGLKWRAIEAHTAAMQAYSFATEYAVLADLPYNVDGTAV